MQGLTLTIDDLKTLIPLVEDGTLKEKLTLMLEQLEIQEDNYNKLKAIHEKMLKLNKQN